MAFRRVTAASIISVLMTQCSVVNYSSAAQTIPFDPSNWRVNFNRTAFSAPLGVQSTTSEKMHNKVSHDCKP